MERRTRLRTCLVSERRRRRLGAVQLRLLELHWTVGLDLGGLFAVGIRSVSLWALGIHRQPVGLVPGSLLCASDLRPGLCGLPRWITLEPRIFLRRRMGRRNWLVSTGSARMLSPVVPDKQPLLPQRE